MNRYTIVHLEEFTLNETAEVSIDGKWVRYSDVALIQADAVIKAVNEALEALKVPRTSSETRHEYWKAGAVALAKQIARHASQLTKGQDNRNVKLLSGDILTPSGNELRKDNDTN